MLYFMVCVLLKNVHIKYNINSVMINTDIHSINCSILIRNMRILLLYIVLIVAPLLSSAQTWTGNVSDSWHVAGNWSPQNVPGPNATVTIPHVGNNPTPVIRQNTTVREISLTNTSALSRLTVTDGATLTVTERFNVNSFGHLILDNGHLQFNGNGGGQRRINMGWSNALIHVLNNGSLSSPQANLQVNGELLLDGGTITLGDGFSLSGEKFFRVTTGQVSVFGQTQVFGFLDGGAGNFVFNGNPSNNQHTVTIRSGGRFYMAPSTFASPDPPCEENTPVPPPLSGGTIDFLVPSDVQNNGRLFGGDAVITYHKATTSQGDAITRIHNGTLIYKDNASFSNSASLIITCKGSVFVEGNGTFQQSGVMDVGDGNLTISGNAIFQNTGTLFGGNGNITFEDDVTIAGNGGSIFAENSTITFSGGTFNNSGTFDPGTSTFVFSGDGDQQITGTNSQITFYNLEVEEGSDVQSSQNVLVLNNMAVEEDSFFDVDDGLTINVIGEVTGDPFVDTNRPYIITLTIVGESTIQARFNETLTQSSAQNTANYRIDDAIFNGTQIGTVSSATLGGSQNNVVTLELNLNTVSGVIEQGIDYFLVVNNISNLTQGTVSPDHRKRFGYPSFAGLQLRYYPGGLDKTNLKVWFDAADPDFIFADPGTATPATDGDVVAFWADKSGNNRNAVQPAVPFRPLLTFDQAIGGRPSLSFNNTEFMVFDGSFAVGSEYSITSLVARSSSKTHNIYLGGTGTGANNNLHIFWSGSTNLRHHHWGGNDYSVTVPAYDGSLFGEIHTMDLALSRTPNRGTWRNGELLGSRNDNRTLVGWPGSAIGRYIDAANPTTFNFRFEGYVSEMIMHNKALSNSERIIIENYLAAKWGQDLATAAKKYNTPDGFFHQLAGIGRETGTDLVAETVYTSGGLGFRSSLPGFLNDDGNYLLAAHNNISGVESNLVLINNYILEKWARTWHVEKTLPGNDGTLAIYFDFQDYGIALPESGNDYLILYHPEDPGFSSPSATVLNVPAVISGAQVSFDVSSQDINNGYYTLARYVADAVADPDQTTITAVPTVIEAVGIGQSQITVVAKYFTGEPLGIGGDTVVLQSSAGTLGPVVDNNDGTYTAVLTSSAIEETAVVSGTINGDPITDIATVEFVTGAADAGESIIIADPFQVVADGMSATLITVQLRDYLGNNLTTGGDLVTLSASAGSLGPVTDNNNGTHSAILTSDTVAQTVAINGTINGAPIAEAGMVMFIPGPADPSKTTLLAYPEKITADGESVAYIMVQAIDQYDNVITTGGANVLINATAGTLSAVTDVGSGTYTALLTSSQSVETAIITASINGDNITSTAAVEFVDYMVLNYYPGGLDNTRLQAWYDAADAGMLFSDIGGITPASQGDRVAFLKDKSIFSRHATQELFAARPLLNNAGFGGRPALLFDNAEFLLFDGTFLAGTNYTLSAVVTRTSGKEYNVYLGGSATGENNNLHIFWSGSNRLHYHHFQNDFNVTVPAFDGNQNGELHVFRFSGNSEAPARRIFRNGTFEGSLNSSGALNDWQGAAIGRYTPRGGDFFEGRMAEIIIHDLALTHTERIIIENYTAAKWGHQLNVDVVFYEAPAGFDRELVGIGRQAANDMVTETVFTSGGLGFRSTVGGFLSGINNYLMAAHDGSTGLANELIPVNDKFLERWARSWFIQKTDPNGNGNLSIYFNIFDYMQGFPMMLDRYYLLYHPSDPSFPEASTVVIEAEAEISGIEVVFNLHSSLVNDGYYTLGRVSPGVRYFSRTTGPWDDPETWSLTSHTGSAASQIPGPDDQAIIGANHIVTLTGTVFVDEGSLLINNTGTLVTNQHIIQGSGRFILEPGGTLHIGSANGISMFAAEGNVQTALRNFSQNANYVFDGNNTQQTGNGLPAKVMDLRIDNHAGVNALQSQTVNGQLQLDNGLFSMPPGSSLVANDVQQTNGNLRMQLTLDGDKGWRMITSPVNTVYADLFDGLVSQGFTGANFPDKQPNILWFDETQIGTTNMAWRTPSAKNQQVEGGRGYFHYIFNGAEMLDNGQATGQHYNDLLPVTIDAIGLEHATGGSIFDFGVTYTPRNETMVSLTDTLKINEGWNLIGNPSTASLDWDTASGWTKTNIDETIYIWDPSANNGHGDFLVWNGSFGTLDHGIIAPFQSFWVRANDENPSLLMNDAAKTTGGSFVGNSIPGKTQAYYLPTALTLRLEAGGMEAQAMISFTENGKRGEDPSDAYRLEPMSDNWLKLYTVTTENPLPMVINNLPADFSEQLHIPVYIEGQKGKHPVGGQYKLSWDLPENWPLHWDVYLMDHHRKSVIPMNKGQNTLSFSLHQTQSEHASLAPADHPLDMPAGIIAGAGKNLAENKPSQVTQHSFGSANVGARTASVKSSPSFSIVLIPGEPEEEVGYMAPEAMLLPVFPNPVRDYANIRFSLPEAGNVHINVYDLHGRRIHNITNQSFSSGIHTLTWTPGRLAPGAYFVVMQSGSVNNVQKMIVVR